jgi:hypothetical protein
MGELCPICGSALAEIEYRGKKPDLLALMKRENFCGFLGCMHTDLHEGGKVFVRPVFHPKVWRADPVKRKRGENVNFFKE